MLWPCPSKTPVKAQLESPSGTQPALDQTPEALPLAVSLAAISRTSA